MLLLTMSATAEVVRKIGNTDQTPGGETVLEKQTGTRLLYRAGVYNDYTYNPQRQEGKYYGSGITGAVVGDLGTYDWTDGSLNQAEVEERATRGSNNDDDAPFAGLRRLFRVGSWFK